MLRILSILFVLSPTFAIIADDAEANRFFETKIRPVLVEHCYECHSADAEDLTGGLYLDSRDGIRNGGDTGPAVEPGHAKRSLLWQAISETNRDLQMPPDNPLPEQVAADFAKWINDGAYDPRADAVKKTPGDEFDLRQRREQHWAWQPIAPSNTQLASIDEFIDAKLTHEKLAAAPRADAVSLVRRLYFDLVGLPPPIADVSAFEFAFAADPTKAVTVTVEKLLDDPRFGEHWARHWLDVVRYSETKGHVTDQERPFAWKYRDYVIRAFNDDMPYDQFVVEHIAGDLLDSDEAATATGILYTHEMHFMSVDPVKQRWDEVNAQIDVVSKAFLGMTVECARCHDHKFDAISQADYYSLAGFFLSTEQGRHRVQPRAAQLSEQALDAEKAYEEFLRKKIAGRRKAQSPKASDLYFPISEELGIQTKADTKQLFALMDRLDAIDPTWSAWVRSARDVEGRDAPLLVRGDSSKPRGKVPRRFLSALGGQELDNGEASGRLWLAKQFVDKQNPLTSRVWVNRIWHHLFGRGIVATPNNMGVLGEDPSHPKLLDHLAKRLREYDWSTKAIIREITHSKAYQREARANVSADTSNRWLAHQSVRRLTAEQIRDAMLSVTGKLDATMFGPSVDCFVPSYATANKPSNIPASGPLDGAGRRSVYIKVRRNFFDPFLQKFDFPNPAKPVGRRDVTTVPSQALAMMNSPLVHELAKSWGDTLAELDDLPRERIRNAWRVAFARSPTHKEEEALLELVHQLETRETDSHQIWRDVAHVILNHPDFIWLK